MTLSALQKYLDVVKWLESERIGSDMCGRYVRCRYCTRWETFPCARAHNRLTEMQSAPVQDVIPDGLLPAPSDLDRFGDMIAAEETEGEDEADEQLEEMIEEIAPAPPAEEPAAEAPAEEPAAEAPAEEPAAEAPAEEPAAEAPAEEPAVDEEATVIARIALPEPPAGPLSAPADGRPHVIARGKRGSVRICYLQRKLLTVSDVVGK